MTTIVWSEPSTNSLVRVVSDRWLHAETRLPISFKHLILPEKFPPSTPLLELQPLPLSALHNKEFESIYSSTIQTFNKIQTQVFQALYTSDENVFIGAPTGNGKTICTQFALLHLWSKREQPRAVCIEPYQEMVDQRVAECRRKFSGKEIWDILSRRWQQCKNVQNIDLLIADKIQLVGGEVGPTYEVVISRTRYVAAQMEVKTRIIACGVSLAFLSTLFSTDQISKQIIKHSKGASIESVYDVVEMEDGKRKQTFTNGWSSYFYCRVRHTSRSQVTLLISIPVHYHIITQ
ncbi:P-loop containing nucleoside triphosphate hydrolase protein [Suillus tomentosus]|nr:P-loop containing nucleoside triphosphate hydrolase protein [Suillus tomentosus]